MSDERGLWYLLTGLVLGLILGVVYSWTISPLRYVDTSPASLRVDFKDQYRALIAAAFVANGDLPRAQARLALLEEDAYRVLAAQAQQRMAQGGASDEARALGSLAAALAREIASGGTSSQPSPTSSGGPGAAQTGSSVTPSPSGTGLVEITSSTSFTPTAVLTATVEVTMTGTLTPTESLTPTPTRTPLPTLTPTATQGAPFALEDRSMVCDPTLQEALLQVWVSDAAGQPVPGVEVIVNWPEGEEHFFTGLKPEVGPGYADFTMDPGVSYTLRLTDGGDAVTGLSPEECALPTGERYWGSWVLSYTQP